MARVLGIDPGTGSMDLLLLDDEDNRVLYEEAVPRPLVTRNPRIIIDRVMELNEEYGLDAVAAPSGYGIPFIRDRDIVDYIMEATFINENDLRENLQIQGLRRVMLELHESSLNVYFTPGVVQLSTIPRYRKVNRVDMGTADKVFTVAAALYDAVELRGEPVGETSFIVVEAGKAYNAAIAVEAGRIIDGVGGTLDGHGYLGAGAFDAEVAYALASLEGSFSRKRLFEGGAGYLAGRLDLEDYTRGLERGDERAVEAAVLLSESIIKSVFQLLPSFRGRPRSIYVSGRLFRAEPLASMILERLEDALSRYNLGLKVRRVPRLGSVTKEGATGAALLASGYAGGRYEWIVDSLRLRESRGSIFEHVILAGLWERAPRYFTRVGREGLEHR